MRHRQQRGSVSSQLPILRSSIYPTSQNHLLTRLTRAKRYERMMKANGINHYQTGPTILRDSPVRSVRRKTSSTPKPVKSKKRKLDQFAGEESNNIADDDEGAPVLKRKRSKGIKTEDIKMEPGVKMTAPMPPIKKEGAIDLNINTTMTPSDFAGQIDGAQDHLNNFAQHHLHGLESASGAPKDKAQEAQESRLIAD